MATIEQIVRDGHGSASNGKWRVYRSDSDPFRGTEYELWHHGTLMLRWRQSTRYGVEILSASTGHGSVSDQGGMNTAFSVLGVPYYYSRRGRASILDWTDPDDRSQAPKYRQEHPGLFGQATDWDPRIKSFMV